MSKFTTIDEGELKEIEKTQELHPLDVMQSKRYRPKKRVNVSIKELEELEDYDEGINERTIKKGMAEHGMNILDTSDPSNLVGQLKALEKQQNKSEGVQKQKEELHKQTGEIQKQTIGMEELSKAIMQGKSERKSKSKGKDAIEDVVYTKEMRRIENETNEKINKLKMDFKNLNKTKTTKGGKELYIMQIHKMQSIAKRLKYTIPNEIIEKQSKPPIVSLLNSLIEAKLEKLNATLGNLEHGIPIETEIPSTAVIPVESKAIVKKEYKDASVLNGNLLGWNDDVDSITSILLKKTPSPDEKALVKLRLDALLHGKKITAKVHKQLTKRYRLPTEFLSSHNAVESPEYYEPEEKIVDSEMMKNIEKFGTGIKRNPRKKTTRRKKNVR